jgi:hypothetical protein
LELLKQVATCLFAAVTTIVKTVSIGMSYVGADNGTLLGYTAANITKAGYQYYAIQHTFNHATLPFVMMTAAG